jgi:hypothetical protein
VVLHHLLFILIFILLKEAEDDVQDEKDKNNQIEDKLASISVGESEGYVKHGCKRRVTYEHQHPGVEEGLPDALDRDDQLLRAGGLARVECRALLEGIFDFFLLLNDLLDIVIAVDESCPPLPLKHRIFRSQLL